MTWGYRVVTCEHASNRLPRACGSLGLSEAFQRSHWAWDIGAARLARVCARRLGAPLHLGRYSRVLVDLNRSPDHPRVIPLRAGGRVVPGNLGLSAAERRRRIVRYHRPYRNAVLAEVRKLVLRHGACLHLSVHTFTPVWKGRERPFDVGLLYDPARPCERELARRLRRRLRDAGIDARLNRPYLGTSDGLTTGCRRLFPARRYAGIEIEVNQRLLSAPRRAAAVAEVVARCVEGASATASRSRPQGPRAPSRGAASRGAG